MSCLKSSSPGGLRPAGGLSNHIVCLLYLGPALLVTTETVQETAEMLKAEECLELEGEWSFDCKNPIIRSIPATLPLHHSSVFSVISHKMNVSSVIFNMFNVKGEKTVSYCEALKQF